MFRLRFSRSSVRFWAGRYDYGQDDRVFLDLAPAVKRRGFLARDEFLRVCHWKTPRTQPRCARNDADTVEAITRIALASATPDRMKIRMLIMLEGVGWPTASVILHFFDRRRFPILDYRALWSVGHDRPPRYTSEFWHEYTRFTRKLAAGARCDMRTLDRALWQYSKERQPGGSGV